MEVERTLHRSAQETFTSPMGVRGQVYEDRPKKKFTKCLQTTRRSDLYFFRMLPLFQDASSPACKRNHVWCLAHHSELESNRSNNLRNTFVNHHLVLVVFFAFEYGSNFSAYLVEQVILWRRFKVL